MRFKTRMSQRFHIYWITVVMQPGISGFQKNKFHSHKKERKKSLYYESVDIVNNDIAMPCE